MHTNRCTIPAHQSRPQLVDFLTMDPDFPKPFNPNEPPQPSSSSTPLSRLTPATTATSSTPTRLPIPPSSSHHNNSKRKRGLGVVTPNACTECRKKRAKVRALCPAANMQVFPAP